MLIRSNVYLVANFQVDTLKFGRGQGQKGKFKVGFKIKIRKVEGHMIRLVLLIYEILGTLTK